MNRKSLVIKCFVIISDIIFLLIALFVDKVISVMRILAPICGSKLFGLECGICGATHSVYYLLHGDVAMAFKSNLLIPIITVFFIVAYFLCHLAYLFNIDFARRILKKYIFTLPCFFSVTVPFLIYGVVRSICSLLR